MPKTVQVLTAPALVPAAKGKLNGVYQVKELIGEGAFSKVLKCFDTKNKRTVAVKVLKTIQKDHQASARRETEVLKRANEWQGSEVEDERFIVTSYEYFCRDVVPHLVLEYLPYRLRDVLDKKILTEKDAIAVAYSLLRALEVLSKASEASPIVHGDLKPENIMLHRSGQVKVIDFGSSFFENDRPYKFCQTREYRAPEVILRKNFGSAIDAWSLACVVAECLTGRKLFGSQLDSCHVYIVVERLGLPPDSWIESCEKRFDYFQKSENGCWEIRPTQAKLGRTVVPGSRPPLPDSESLVSDFIRLMLEYDPERRIRPGEALKHPLFQIWTNLDPKIDMRMVDSQYLSTKR